MANQIKGVTVLEGEIWEALRDVKISKVNIVRDSSLKYQLVPTYQDHAFMKKSGYTKYIYKAWVKKVEKLTDGMVQLYDYNFFPSVKLEMSDDQINEWKQMDEFIEFV